MSSIDPRLLETLRQIYPELNESALLAVAHVTHTLLEHQTTDHTSFYEEELQLERVVAEGKQQITQSKRRLQASPPPCMQDLSESDEP
jgi:hypothetical protein